jgi:hypothetical protein
MYVDEELRHLESGGVETVPGVRHEHAWYYESAEDYLLTDVLDFCGCGYPVDAGEFVRDVLAHVHGPGNEELTAAEIPAPRRDEWIAHLIEYRRRESELFGGNDGLMMVVYYMLTNLELMEHGGCVPGWLTEHGRRVLCDLIELYGPSRFEDVEDAGGVRVAGDVERVDTNVRISALIPADIETGCGEYDPAGRFHYCPFYHLSFEITGSAVATCSCPVLETDVLDEHPVSGILPMRSEECREWARRHRTHWKAD